MYQKIIIICISTFLYSQILSCNSGTKIGYQAVEKIVKAFAQNAGRNSKKFLNFENLPGVVTTKNGRLAHYAQVAKLAKIKIPNPTDLSIIKTGKIHGTTLAKDAVKKSDIDLLLYDSHGNVIVYANAYDNGIVYSAANRIYQQKLVRVVDDIHDVVNKSQIANETEIYHVIRKALQKNMPVEHTQPYLLDISTGALTFNVEFAHGSQIVGSMNIYNAVRKGLVVGAGGYLLAKKS